ncbi:MAG: hypothetical protein ACREYB_01620 [Casimicrobiaceae bacterium]
MAPAWRCWQRELDAIIRLSLGEPAGWLDSVDEPRLFELAQRHGIAVADGGVAASDDAAIALAARIGYPVIVRSGYGSAGSAAACCQSAGEVRAAVRRFPRQDAWGPRDGPRFVVAWAARAAMRQSSLVAKAIVRNILLPA